MSIAKFDRIFVAMEQKDLLKDIISHVCIASVKQAIARDMRCRMIVFYIRYQLFSPAYPCLGKRAKKSTLSESYIITLMIVPIRYYSC